MMEELISILEELHPEVDFETETGLVTNGIIDSFDIVTIISEIGDRFDVVVSAEYITPENFDSAETIYDMIQRIEEEE